jgi:hypothetical protein
MKATWEVIVIYKLVWLRVVLYVLLPSVGAFLTQTETWSGETWDATHIFLKIRLIISSAVPGGIALAAYVDQSLDRARNKLEDKRRGDTEQFVREHTGP